MTPKFKGDERIKVKLFLRTYALLRDVIKVPRDIRLNLSWIESTWRPIWDIVLYTNLAACTLPKWPNQVGSLDFLWSVYISLNWFFLGLPLVLYLSQWYFWVSFSFLIPWKKTLLGTFFVKFSTKRNVFYKMEFSN